jgi:hypothetical protein
MTLSVDIKPELEERLVARAQSHGQSLEGFIQRLLENEAAAAEATGSRVLTGVDKAAAFEAWAKSFPRICPTSLLKASVAKTCIGYDHHG